MDPENPADAPPEPPGPADAPPQKPELRIRDLGFRPRGCNVCGEPKPPYVEIDMDGVPEYTCKECYERQFIEITACRKCGAAMEAADAFCGKCGSPRTAKCPSCGAEAGEDDRFCGKCGTGIT